MNQGSLYEYINRSQHETWPGSATPFEAELGSDARPELLAEDAARIEYDYLGPTAEWPQDLEVFSDGESLGVYHVEIIREPTFVAVPCTEEDAA